MPYNDYKFAKNLFISELNNSVKSKYNLSDLINGEITIYFANNIVFKLNSFGLICLS